jgi:hypothetical protein
MDIETENWSGTAVRPIGLIIRKDPNNLEMPFVSDNVWRL